MEPSGGSFWDAIRGWADARGLMLPENSQQASSSRASVPASVCENCPICQSAATLDQLQPDVMDELTDLARTLIGGVGSALAAAAEQRMSATSDQEVSGESTKSDLPTDI